MRLRAQAETGTNCSFTHSWLEIDEVYPLRISKADYVTDRARWKCMSDRKTMTDWHENQAERAQGPRYQTIRIGLDPGPETLRERIGSAHPELAGKTVCAKKSRVIAQHGPDAAPPLDISKCCVICTGTGRIT